mmetsp:Transcript_98725/g.294819  ORF Transcript_98725/g.294819 Transcript_98725/m.294819 type:complete len:222 (-) Transcript_98725:52-717(-)
MSQGDGVEEAALANKALRDVHESDLGSQHLRGRPDGGGRLAVDGRQREVAPEISLRAPDLHLPVVAHAHDRRQRADSRQHRHAAAMRTPCQRSPKSEGRLPLVLAVRQRQCAATDVGAESAGRVHELQLPEHRASGGVPECRPSKQVMLSDGLQRNGQTLRQLQRGRNGTLDVNAPDPTALIGHKGEAAAVDLDGPPPSRRRRLRPCEEPLPDRWLRIRSA